MKNFLYILFLLIFAAGSAQKTENIFENSESGSVYEENSKMSDLEVDTYARSGTPGGLPGDDDLPIDDYIPLLVLTAIGIIVYTRFSKKEPLWVIEQRWKATTVVNNPSPQI